MRLANLFMLASVALGTACAGTLSTIPGTYYSGIEDGGAPSVEGQGDFNDMIFSLVGSGLTLDTLTGQWNSAPNLSNPGPAFWDNASGDGAKMNLGYCLFGGGNCTIQGGPIENGGYLGGGSNAVTDVLFSSGGGTVTATLLAKITAWVGTDTLGWYDPNDPNMTLHTIFSGPMTPGTVINFDPSAVFGLWTIGNNGTGPVFLSDAGGGPHFAFFGQLDTPEPDTMAMMATGILLFGLGLFTRRMRRSHGPTR